MKTLRNTAGILCIGFSMFMQAGVPENSPSLLKEKTSSEILIKNTNSIFTKYKNIKVASKPGFSFDPSAKLNTEFVSGRRKKTESSFPDILRRDLRVKFKLNRNMNIIFSYN